MLNHYETVFITTPVLSEIQVKEAVEKFKAVITENGGNIEHEEAWGTTHAGLTKPKQHDRFLSLNPI